MYQTQTQMHTHIYINVFICIYYRYYVSAVGMSNYRVYPDLAFIKPRCAISSICIYIVATAQWCKLYLLKFA